MIENVTILTLLIYLVIGMLLGLMLGAALKGRGFGWFGNICLGFLGAFLGGLAMTFSGHITDNHPLFNAAAAAVGSVILILIVAIFKRR